MKIAKAVITLIIKPFAITTGFLAFLSQDDLTHKYKFGFSLLKRLQYYFSEVTLSNLLLGSSVYHWSYGRALVMVL
jgi:hypothetical protein